MWSRIYCTHEYSKNKTLAKNNDLYSNIFLIHACIYVCEVCICSYHINSSIICIFRGAQWFGSFNFLSIFTNLQKWESIFYCFNILINIYIYNKSKFTRHFLLKSQESERSCIRVVMYSCVRFIDFDFLQFCY